MALSVPLQCSPNGRYFLDGAGRPVWLCGDSAWDLVCNLDPSNYDRYFGTRARQGFNWIILQVMPHSYMYNGQAYGNAPANPSGVLPFSLDTTGATYTQAGARASQNADVTTPVDAFFASALAAVQSAASWGHYVLLVIMPWGFAGARTAGWWPDITDAANSNTDFYNFGLYLANGNGVFAGFKNQQNIIICHGSDYGDQNGSPPSAAGQAKIVQMHLGLRDGGCSQLATGDWQSPDISTDQAAFTDYMQTNRIYTYGGTYPSGNPVPGGQRTYTQARLGWQYVPTIASQSKNGLAIPPALPAWDGETAYIDSLFTEGTRPDIRKCMGWIHTSGGTAGEIFGDERIWRFAGTLTDWENAILDGGSLDMARKAQLVRATPAWYNLIPSELSGMRRIVTSSNGTQSGEPDTYVGALCTPGGPSLLAYFPPTGASTQAGTFDLRSMQAGPLLARWYDQTSGNFTAIAGTFDNSMSAQSFQIPGTNSASNTDWWLQIVGAQPGVGNGVLFGGF